MRPRYTLALAVAILLALAPAAAAKPNIVVLMTDDQTLDSMSVMPKTVALLGGGGTTFTRSFVNYSLCCPSRATLKVRPQPRRARQCAARRGLLAASTSRTSSTRAARPSLPRRRSRGADQRGGPAELAPVGRALAARLALLRGCAGASCRAKPALRLAAVRRRCGFVTAVRGDDADVIERVEFLVRRRPKRGAAGRPRELPAPGARQRARVP